MKLFRRSPDNPNCAWSVRFSVRNKIHAFSTQTTDRALALVRAKDYRNKIVAGAYGLADSMKSRGGCSTFAELYKTYDALPVPEALTRKRNIASMRAVLAASKLDDTARINQLGSHVAMAYQSAMKGARPGCNAALVTANTNLRRARSLFSRHAMLAYKPVLTVPVDAVQSFAEVPFLKTAKPLKMLPSPEAMAKAVEVLRDKPDHYRAYLMAALAGCRASEIIAARRSWVEGNIIRIGAFPDQFKTKSGAERRVAIPESLVEVLLAGSDPVFLIGPRRREIVGRELNHILKTECGFLDGKPIHSLRRWFGSQLWTHQTPAIAQMAMGHSSIKVTESAYATNLTQQKPIAWAG